MDVSEAIVFRSEAVFTTEGADIIVYEVGKIALGNTDSWNVTNEVIKEVLIFLLAEVSVDGVAS